MASLDYNQVKKGMVLLREDGQLWLVLDREISQLGNWRSHVSLKLKNLATGTVNLVRERPQDRVEIAHLDKRAMQYLYAEGNGYVFMDQETFDQVTLSKEWVGDQILYLRENDVAQVVLYQERPVLLELPGQVELAVAETAGFVKGGSAAAQYKTAKMETGLELLVPPFIEVGERVQIDTRTGEYLGRAK